MNAEIGDKIIVRGHRLGEADRECEVLEVQRPDGAPPYRVRWAASGHETLFFPGPDATVQRLHRSSS